MPCQGAPDGAWGFISGTLRGPEEATMGIRSSAILILLSAAVALAKGAPDADALAKLPHDDPKKAAGLTKLMLQARSSMGLDRQPALARHLFAMVPMKGRTPKHADALVRLKGLAGPKTYAWFSPQHLAYAALTDATASGDYSGLEPALALAAKRSSVKYGRYAQAMAGYAKALRAAKRPEDAVKALTKVLEACGKHGWARLALHAGLELSLAHLAAGDAEAPKRVLQETLAAVREDTNPAILYDLRSMFATRLKASHADLAKAWDDVLGKRLKDYTRSGSATAGGAGRRTEPTPIGKALRTWKKSKPLVRVTREGDTFHIAYSFGKLAERTHKRSGGIAHVDAGGLVLAFWQSGVRVQQVCPMNEAVGGANSAPGRWQQFDDLADGETWVLYATGEIRFK